MVGVGGSIDDNWSWDATASIGRADAATTSRNQIRAADLQAALNGTTRQTALNPFGPSDNPDVVNRLFTVSNSNYSNRAEMFDVGVTGSLFELPGGDVGIAGGSELRKEVIVQDPDTAAFVGSGGGTPYRGDRDTFSAYVEATMPFTRQIEVQVAGRYENYSDFGTTFKPKIGAKFKLPSTKIRRRAAPRFVLAVVQGSRPRPSLHGVHGWFLRQRAPGSEAPAGRSDAAPHRHVRQCRI
jgi:iron complex outermembrane receptor protein